MKSNFIDRLANLGCQVSEDVMPLNLDDMTTHWKTVAEVGMSRLFAADEALAFCATEKYKAMAQRGKATTVNELSLSSLCTSLNSRAACALYTRVRSSANGTDAALWRRGCRCQ